jgi:uracil-DNA glycosylase
MPEVGHFSVTKADRLAEIAERIEADKSLEIARNATHSVPGEGNPDADIVFVGEAPGQKEDLTGQPFVGAAGKFLEEMLGSINLTRSDVFITNTVKWRPPDNRDPLPDEIQACWEYLQEQLAVIDPKLIVTLGKHALERFLPGQRISQIHGQPKRRDGQVYLPLYHPAAALYNGSMRAQLIGDFSKIPATLKKIDASAAPLESKIEQLSINDTLQ